MISVDTNIIVRILTGDDPEQAKRAVRLFENNNDIFISKTVILETTWVLRHAYGITPDTIITGFHKLFGLPNVTVEDSWAAFQALAWYKEGFELADALHLSSSLKATHFATFDKKLIKKASKIKSIEVIYPQ
jgi:predicted nucleic-acid-binding protein